MIKKKTRDQGIFTEANQSHATTKATLKSIRNDSGLAKLCLIGEHYVIGLRPYTTRPLPEVFCGYMPRFSKIDQPFMKRTYPKKDWTSVHSFRSRVRPVIYICDFTKLLDLPACLHSNALMLLSTSALSASSPAISSMISCGLRCGITSSLLGFFTERSKVV